MAEPIKTIKHTTTATVFSTKIESSVVSNENEEIPINGSIRVTGQYPQNFIDVPTYDLSKIKVIPDTNFKFIIRLRMGEEYSKDYYTSKIFYDVLQNSLNNKDPHLSNQYLRKSAIIDIDLMPLLTRIRTFRDIELSKQVVVTKNLFLRSEGNSESFNEVLETILYDDLIKYINWIVAKPSNDYDMRLLSPKQIGESVLFIEEEIIEPQPPVVPSETDPPYSQNQRPFDPVGRPGAYLNEIVMAIDGNEYRWNGVEWNKM